VAVEGEAATIVGHGKLHLRIFPPEGYLHGRGVRVPGRVDEGFMDNAIEIVGQGCGNLCARGLQAQGYGQVPLTFDLCAQLMQTGSQVEIRLRRAERGGLQFLDEEA